MKHFVPILIVTFESASVYLPFSNSRRISRFKPSRHIIHIIIMCANWLLASFLQFTFFNYYNALFVHSTPCSYAKYIFCAMFTCNISYLNIHIMHISVFWSITDKHYSDIMRCAPDSFSCDDDNLFVFSVLSSFLFRYFTYLKYTNIFNTTVDLFSLFRSL